MITVTVSINGTDFDLEAQIDSIQPAEPDVGIMSSYVEDYSLYWADGFAIPLQLEEDLLDVEGQDEKIREKLDNSIHEAKDN